MYDNITHIHKEELCILNVCSYPFKRLSYMSQYGLTAMISPFCGILTRIHKIPVRIHDCRRCSSHTAGHSILQVNGNHCVCRVSGTVSKLRQSHLERLFYYRGRHP